ncbi:MAG: hypothetical protein M5U13_00175 [Thermoanaerobaculia bacterium]|nr:hypothetical protein [Thermoanaerobaculia bacterium]
MHDVPAARHRRAVGVDGADRVGRDREARRGGAGQEPRQLDLGRLGPARPVEPAQLQPVAPRRVGALPGEQDARAAVAREELHDRLRGEVLGAGDEPEIAAAGRARDLENEDLRLGGDPLIAGEDVAAPQRVRLVEGGAVAEQAALGDRRASGGQAEQRGERKGAQTHRQAFRLITLPRSSWTMRSTR